MVGSLLRINTILGTTAASHRFASRLLNGRRKPCPVAIADQPELRFMTDRPSTATRPSGFYDAPARQVAEGEA